MDEVPQEHEVDAQVNIGLEPPRADSPADHDDTFYLSGQSVVFKVEDKLFKVDPALFTRGEDSAFKTMLALPQITDTLQEGIDDANPIVLHGDTALQFRTLLWGLHSYKLSLAHVSDVDVDRYVQLAKISHKYDLRRLEGWATDGLIRLAQNNVSICKSQAAPLLDVFSLCNCTEAIKLVLEVTKTMLNARTCSSAEITSLIHVGQRYPLPGLATRGYYAMMLKPRSEWEAEATFTRVDRYRLLNGHYSLSEHSLDSTIESIGVELAAYHLTWGKAWTSFVVRPKEENLRNQHGLRVVDVVGRLRKLLEAFLDVTPSDSKDPAHEPVFRGYLERIIDDLFKNKFSVYFQDLFEST